MANLEKLVKDKLKINYATKKQIDEAEELSETELYIVDPEYAGNKAIATDSNGNFVENVTTDTELAQLSGITRNVQEQINDEIERATQAEATMGSEIGNLSELTTEDKSSLVNALNELDASKQENLTAGTGIDITDNTVSIDAVLDNLNDVTISEPVDNEFLTYNALAGKWLNILLTEIDGGQVSGPGPGPGPTPVSPDGGDSSSPITAEIISGDASTQVFTETLNGGTSMGE